MKRVLFAVSLLLLLGACSGGGQPRCREVGQRWVSPVDGATLLCVPAGEFWMGAGEDDEKARDVEKPQHVVNLDAYWIDATEVTNAQFALCVGAGVCQRSEDPGATGVASKTHNGYFHDPVYADYPVLVYEAYQAEDYCAWAGRRLPTEAEWEKAARGTDGRIYPWGDEAPNCQLANIRGCFPDTTAVGSFPEGNSPYGVSDMAGNVWEWVGDTFDPEFYNYSPLDNPTGPEEEGYQIRRGGGWRGLLVDLRTTRRASGKAEHYFDGQMGFRCVLSVP